MRSTLVVILVLSLAAVACAQATGDPFAGWPYRLRLRVVDGELADFTGLAMVTVNLGPKASADLADVRIVDANGYERPWSLRASVP